jgi:tetratricopeptide (TPR) repeat protein
MKQLIVGYGALLLLLYCALPARAQMPSNCKLPVSAGNVPAGTPPVGRYEATGAWFAQKGNLDCSAAAFEQALRLRPRSARLHFDLGLIRQQQEKPVAAVKELKLALQYDPGLLQARCALGSALSDPVDAKAEFRKALAKNPHLVCALNGIAQILAEGKDYDAAARYWRQTVQVEPNAPDLQLSLATAIYKAAKERQANGLPPATGSRVADAIQLLTELLNKHPRFTDAHFTLGNMYANQKAYRKAANEYRVVVLQNPADTVALAAEVEMLVDASAYTDALAPARDYARREPDHPLGHILLGTVYLELGDYSKAKSELARGVAMAPDSFKARYRLGVALARLGKPDQALPELRQALVLEPGNRSAQSQLVAVLRALGKRQQARQIVEQLQKETGENAVENRIAFEGKKANALMQSGKPAEAAQIYRHMLQEKADSARTAYNLALALDAMHDTKGAEKVLREAVKINPKRAGIRAELGRLELREGDLQSAQKWLQSALALKPALVDARGDLATVYAREGDLLTAEKLLRRALADDPKYEQGYLMLGQILARQDRKVESEKILSQAIALDPNDPALLTEVADANMQMGQLSEGIALLRKVADLTPSLAVSHLDLALALASNHDLTDALAETSKAVQLAPKSGVAHFYRGRILYDMGRSQEAISEFETANKLDPNIRGLRYFWALSEMQKGKYKLATTLLEEAVKLQPNNARAWYVLGQSYEHESNTVQAVAAWKHAISIDPKFSQALFSLARVLRSTDRDRAKQLMARYATIQQERRVLDRVDLLANHGLEAALTHNWSAADRQFKEAIAACGNCVEKAQLYRKLGIVDCQAGDLDKCEKELLTSKSIDPNDPVTQAALKLAARARSEHDASKAGNVH